MWEVVIVKIVALRFVNDELERETDTLRGNIAKWLYYKLRFSKDRSDNCHLQGM